MAFQSFHFLVFFIVVFFVTHFVCRGNVPRKVFLTVASYYFYMVWDWRFAGLLLFLTLVNFYLGRRIHEATDRNRKRLFLGISLATSLGVLGYFKYANFFIDSANALLTSIGFGDELPLLNVLLPVGISFYTFQSITYSLDIYRDRMQPVHSVLDFTLFVAFFPQLVAGPIVRAHHFLPQLQSVPEIKENQIESGLALITRGLIKKIAFADTLGRHFVDPAFASPSDYSPIFLLIGAAAYSYQIYMDFSGYTDIARGIARSLGYELQINFDRPYKAATVSNFWQRWHISMSSFFRDYLFFGLGGSRSGNVYVNVLITFVAIGAWHGAGWNFIVYGFIHGSVVAFERYRRNRRKRLGLPDPKDHGLGHWTSVAAVFAFVSLARVIFRAESWSAAGGYFSAMADFSVTNTPVSAIGAICLMTAVILHYTPSRWTFGWKGLFVRFPWPLQSATIVATIYILTALSSGEAPFIYFQF